MRVAYRVAVSIHLISTVGYDTEGGGEVQHEAVHQIALVPVCCR